MKVIAARLTPERDAYTRTVRTLAPAHVVELGRELQRLAFPEKDLGEGFEPAPVYIGQAWELHRDVNARGRFIQILALLK